MTSTPASTFVPADCSGTSLQGYIDTSFEELVQVFGAPHIEGGDKTTAEWSFISDDGIRFTIYDWKQSSTPYNIYSWHVGGKNVNAISTVVSILRNHGVNVRDYRLHPTTW